MKLIDSFYNYTGKKLGKLISNGNGKVFELKGSNTKIVKIDSVSMAFRDIDKIFRTLKYLKRFPSQAVVKIFQYGKFEHNGSEYYYYIMERLQKLPYNYAKSLLVIVDDFQFDCSELSLYSSKVRNFLNSLNKLKCQYDDWHTGNIMQTKGGRIKLIDIESFYFL